METEAMMSTRCANRLHDLCKMATCDCACHKDEPEAGVADAMALDARSDDFINDTVQAYYDLGQRVQALEGKTPQSKTMRIRVNASRTAKGYSVDATCEVTFGDVDMGYEAMGEQLQDVALVRLESLMAKLDAKYPRES